MEGVSKPIFTLISIGNLDNKNTNSLSKITSKPSSKDAGLQRATKEKRNFHIGTANILQFFPHYATNGHDLNCLWTILVLGY